MSSIDKSEKAYEEILSKLDILRLTPKQSEKIIEIKKIGSGGFGKVMSGTYLTLPIAIKKMKNFKFEDFYREINVIRQFRHIYVPNLYFILNEKKKNINIISELIKGKTLDDYIKRTKPSDLQLIVHLLDLSTVLNHFHNFNLIHRDLKPSNVMIDQNLELKLLDFGISKITQNRSFTTTVAMGTILYMAPENFDTQYLSGQTNSELSKTKITGRVDVWAFGCIVSEIFSKCKPWTPIANDDTAVISHLFNKSEFPIPVKITNVKIRKLIENCTKVMECDRYNFHMVNISLREILCDLVKERKLEDFNDNHKYLKDELSFL